MLLNEATTAAPIFSLAPALVFLPLVGLLINLIFGKRMREAWVGAVASLAVGLTFVIALIFAASLAGNPEPVSYTFLEWIRIGTFDVNWAFRIDTLSVTMMLVVSGVGTLIHIYAIGYMHEDVRHNDDPGRFRRFFVYLNLFIAAMMILISADNYLMLFVGWEGVGLCSYLLIGFWFEKGKDGIANAQAAKKAFVVNRVGDFGLLIALFIMFAYFGSLDFSVVFEKAPAVAAATPAVLVAMTLFMLLGVTGKSAQIPLYVWLPDAMAGPTPVSALIHAATMVTAGVYLVVRSTPLFIEAPVAQSAVMWVGAVTAFFAATIALGQSDIKKVLAYSTVSQLGFMVAAAGMGAGVAAMFHLVTHAFFKALLFLGAGSVILGMEHGAEHGGGHGKHGNSHHSFDPQDMGNMGGLRKRMPLTFAVYLIGALALAGIAPLAGFFSKDEIILSAQHTNLGVFILLILSAFLTAFYMGRQLLLIFFGSARTEAAGAAVESKPVVTTPLVVLAVLSALGGALNLPGVYTLEHWLEHTLEHVAPGEFSIATAGISLAVALLGLFVAYLIYGRKFNTKPTADPLSGNFLYSMLENKWKIDELYNLIIIRPYRGLAEFLSNPVDLGVINNISAGLAWLMPATADVLRRAQNGYVRSYALVVFIGVVLMLAFILVK